MTIGTAVDKCQLLLSYTQMSKEHERDGRNAEQDIVNNINYFCVSQC